MQRVGPRSGDAAARRPRPHRARPETLPPRGGPLPRQRRAEPRHPSSVGSRAPDPRPNHRRWSSVEWLGRRLPDGRADWAPNAPARHWVSIVPSGANRPGQWIGIDHRPDLWIGTDCWRRLDPMRQNGHLCRHAVRSRLWPPTAAHRSCPMDVRHREPPLGVRRTFPSATNRRRRNWPSDKPSCRCSRTGKREKDPRRGPLLLEKSGGVLLSQGVYSQVPSALVGLTSVFGMGTGVTPPP